MLKRKEQKPVYRSKVLFRLVDTYFTALVTRLSAEYVFLGLSPEYFLGELRSLCDFDCVIRDEDINGDFVRGGRIVSDDKEKAGKILCESLLFWLDEKNAQMRAYAKFYNECFSRLAYVKPDERSREFAAANENPLAELDASGEHDLFGRIIRGEMEKGDSVSPILFPLFDDPKLHYVIEPQIYHKTVQRMIARAGDDMILREDDPHGVDFLLAFTDSLPFAGQTHKREFMARLFTLLN